MGWESSPGCMVSGGCGSAFAVRGCGCRCGFSGRAVRWVLGTLLAGSKGADMVSLNEHRGWCLWFSEAA